MAPRGSLCSGYLQTALLVIESRQADAERAERIGRQPADGSHHRQVARLAYLKAGDRSFDAVQGIEESAGAGDRDVGGADANLGGLGVKQLKRAIFADPVALDRAATQRFVLERQRRKRTEPGANVVREATVN